MRISITCCGLFLALLVSLMCGSCRPVTICSSSFEDVAETEGIEDVWIQMDSWGKSFYLKAEFESDRDTYIRPEDVVVLSGDKRRKVKLYQRHSLLPDTLLPVVKGHNTMRIYSKMTRRKSDTLSVSVRFPDDGRKWEVARFVPANGVYGHFISGMKVFGKDFGSDTGRYRLTALCSSASPFYLSYDVFVEPGKGAVLSMSKEERQTWDRNIHYILDSLKIEYDRDAYWVRFSVQSTPYYCFRSNLGLDGSLPVLAFMFGRKDRKRIERIPDFTLLPCDAIMLDGVRVIDDTIRIEGGRTAVRVNGIWDEDVIIMSEKSSRPKDDSKGSDTQSSYPFYFCKSGHSLSFYQPCAGCALSLFRNGEPVYESEIDEFWNITIPTSFSGPYELRVTCGDTVYEAEVTF